MRLSAHIVALLIRWLVAPTRIVATRSVFSVLFGVAALRLSSPKATTTPSVGDGDFDWAARWSTRIVATLRTIVRRPRSSSRVGERAAEWQLFNSCSGGYVQTFLRFVNALGRRSDVCLSATIGARMQARWPILFFSVFCRLDARHRWHDRSSKRAIAALFVRRRSTVAASADNEGKRSYTRASHGARVQNKTRFSIKLEEKNARATVVTLISAQRSLQRRRRRAPLYLGSLALVFSRTFSMRNARARF